MLGNSRTALLLRVTGGNTAVSSLSSYYFRRQFHRSSHSSCKLHNNGALACLSRESSYCFRIFELAPCVVELSVLAESVCEGDCRMRKLPSKVTMAPPVSIICNTLQLPSSPQLSGFYRCFHTNPSLHILATIYIVASLSWKPFFPLPPPPWRRTTFY